MGVRQKNRREMVGQVPILDRLLEVPYSTEPVRDPLSAIRPIRLGETHSRPDQDNLFCHLLHCYHYLGLQATFVGENIRYLAYDVHNRPLGCLLFGSAAWKTGARDAYIGWDVRTRERNLPLLTNNTRFLIFTLGASKIPGFPPVISQPETA